VGTFLKKASHTLKKLKKVLLFVGATNRKDSKYEYNIRYIYGVWQGRNSRYKNVGRRFF
jgi:hypothetical protein